MRLPEKLADKIANMRLLMNIFTRTRNKRGLTTEAKEKTHRCPGLLGLYVLLWEDRVA